MANKVQKVKPIGGEQNEDTEISEKNDVYPAVRLIHPLMYMKYIVGTLCFMLLLLVFRHCYQRYSDRATKANLVVMPTGQATFVEMTVCPAYYSAYKEDVLVRHGSSRSKFQDGDYSSRNPNLDPRDFYFSASYKLEEILSSVTVRTASQENPEFLIPINVSGSPSLGWWTVKPYHLYGDCFSLDISSLITELTVTSVTFVSKIDIFIFFHYPGQYLSIDSMTKIPSDVGTQTWVDVSYDLTVDTLKQNSEYPCMEEVDLDQCLYRGIVKTLIDQIGCTLPYLPNINKDNAICQPGNSDLAKSAFELYDSLISYRHDRLCPSPCSSMATFVSSPTTRKSPKKDRAMARVSFKSTVKVSQTVLSYTLASALAELGQYTGLLLGVSLVRLSSSIIEMAAEEARERNWGGGGGGCCTTGGGN